MRRESWEKATEQSQAEIAELSKDHERFALQLQEKDDQIQEMAAFNEELRKSVSDYQSLQEQLSSSSKQLENAKAELVEKTQKITEQGHDIDLLQTRISTADCEMSEREEVLEARQRASNLEIEQLKSNVRELNEANDFIRHKSEVLEQEVGHLKETKAQQEKILAEVEVSRDQFISELEQIKLDLETEKAQIPDLQSKLAESESKCAELESKLGETSKKSAERMSQQTEHVAKLSGELTELTTIKLQLINDNEKLLDELERSMADNDELTKQYETTKEAFDEHRKTHAQLHAEHEKLLEDQISKIEQLQEVSEELEETANSLQLSQSKISMLEQANKQFQQQLVEFGELRQKYKDADAEVNTLIVIKSELQEKCDALSAENHQLKMGLKTHQTKLAESEKSVGSKQSLLEDFEAKFRKLTQDYTTNENALQATHNQIQEAQTSIDDMTSEKEWILIHITHSHAHFFCF